jgi:hypothetical protein
LKGKHAKAKPYDEKCLRLDCSNSIRPNPRPGFQKPGAVFGYEKGAGSGRHLERGGLPRILREHPESLKKLQEDARKSGAAKMSLEDIEALIAKVRQEKSKARA